MLLFEKESALRLISQFVFHDAQGMHQFLMVSRLIAVYSACLEILPFRKKLVGPAQEPRKRKLLNQKESQQAQIGSVCFMLQRECFHLEGISSFMLKKLITFNLDLSWIV